jgi:thiol-disulfide isomerase/thioredoxin
MSDPAPTPTIIAYHFWSPTCAPCKAIKPAVADLWEEFPGIRFIGVNTHSDPQEISRQLIITVVPTMVVLKDGVESGRYSGTDITGYYRILQAALKA